MATTTTTPTTTTTTTTTGPPNPLPHSFHVIQLQNANSFRTLGWKGFLNKDDGSPKWVQGYNRQSLKDAGIPVFYCPQIR